MRFSANCLLHYQSQRSSLLNHHNATFTIKKHLFKTSGWIHQETVLFTEMFSFVLVNLLFHWVAEIWSLNDSEESMEKEKNTLFKERWTCLENKQTRLIKLKYNCTVSWLICENNNVSTFAYLCGIMLSVQWKYFFCTFFLPNALRCLTKRMTEEVLWPLKWSFFCRFQ